MHSNNSNPGGHQRSDEVGEKLRTKIPPSFSGGIAGGISGFQFYKPLFLKEVKRTPPPPHTRARIVSGPFFFARSPAPRGVPVDGLADTASPSCREIRGFRVFARPEPSLVSVWLAGRRSLERPKPSMFQYGGRERGILPPSGCEPRFALPAGSQLLAHLGQHRRDH